MHSLIPLITHHGHSFAGIDGQDWIVDTGFPVSFGNDAVLALAGQSFAVPQDYMGLTAAALSDLIDHPTAGIIGTDILKWRFSKSPMATAGERGTFSVPSIFVTRDSHERFFCSSY